MKNFLIDDTVELEEQIWRPSDFKPNLKIIALKRSWRTHESNTQIYYTHQLQLQSENRRKMQEQNLFLDRTKS